MKHTGKQYVSKNDIDPNWDREKSFRQIRLPETKLIKCVNLVLVEHFSNYLLCSTTNKENKCEGKNNKDVSLYPI